MFIKEIKFFKDSIMALQVRTHDVAHVLQRQLLDKQISRMFKTTNVMTHAFSLLISEVVTDILMEENLNLFNSEDVKKIPNLVLRKLIQPENIASLMAILGIEYIAGTRLIPKEVRKIIMNPIISIAISIIVEGIAQRYISGMW